MNQILVDKYLKEYSFPNKEQIFSCPIDSEPDENGFNIVCAARPSVGATKTITEKFWASALYSCLEDVFIDNEYEKLSEITKVVKLSSIEAITHYLTCLKGSFFEVSKLSELYQMIDETDYKGYMGIDDTGYFVLVCCKSA